MSAKFRPRNTSAERHAWMWERKDAAEVGSAGVKEAVKDPIKPALREHPEEAAARPDEPLSWSEKHA